MSDLIGQYLGRYHILEPIGEGGMAVVYKAYDTRLERYVAIKIIRAGLEQDELFLKRFEREAKALGALHHPNIVKVLDTGEHEGLPFLVMEYVPGDTLKSKLGTAMDWSKAAALILPIARALDYAHEQKVLHRDLKPANIILNAETGAPMLTDFGIAKILESSEKMKLTVTGVGIGTPEYMAPEQGIGTNVDRRADIYGLGVVFYELVVGRRPYVADTPLAVIVKMINDPLPRPSEFLPNLPDFVEQVMLKALAKNPDNRYPTMGAFADALEQLALGKDPHKPILEEVVTMPTKQSTPPPVPPEKPGESLPDAATRPSSAPIRPPEPPQPEPVNLEEPPLEATVLTPHSKVEIPPAVQPEPEPPLEATVVTPRSKVELPVEPLKPEEPVPPVEPARVEAEPPVMPLVESSTVPHPKGAPSMPSEAEATVSYPKGGEPIPPVVEEVAPTAEMFVPQERKEVYLASPASTPAKRKGINGWLIAGIVLIVLCCMTVVVIALGYGLFTYLQK